MSTVSEPCGCPCGRQHRPQDRRARKAPGPRDHAEMTAEIYSAAAAGKVILAGKTDEPLDVTIGLVVIRAADEAEARAFMEGDPCVEAGVMTAELRPYGLAILGK